MSSFVLSRARRRSRRCLQLVVCALGAAAAPLTSLGQSKYVGGAGVGDWTVESNWSPTGAPAAGVNVSFENADGVDRTLNYDYAGSTVELGTLTLDQTGGAMNTLWIPGSALTTGTVVTGSSGAGTVLQSGGTHVTTIMFLAYKAGSRGRYELGEGASLAVAKDVYVGYRGSGMFDHTGGSHNVGTLFIGRVEGSSGAYRMSGSARLDVKNALLISGMRSEPESAVFEQSGGSTTTSQLFVSTGPFSSGTYRLTGSGSLKVTSTEVVGRGGQFVQTGGTHVVGALWVSGYNSFPSFPAIFTISAGVLNAGDVTVGEEIGSPVGGGPGGTLNLAGGNVAVSGALTVTSAEGVINVSGGTVTSGSVKNSGVVNVTGGVLTVNGGVSEAPGTTGVLDASLVIGAGGSVVTNSVRQRALALNGSTVDSLGTAPLLTIRRKTDGGQTSVVRSLSVQTDAAGVPLARIDLSDTALVVNYDVVSEMPTIRSLVRAGWAGGTWMGNGIGSSTAAASASRTGLGYGEALALLGPNGGTFEGQKVDETAVLVKYTVMGDATLNGGVNFDDLLALAKHYNGTNAVWSDGDFNYDAVVNFDDLLILAKNYNGTLAGPVPGAPVGFDADVAAAFAEVSVPEPVALAGLVAGVAATRGRGRRQRVSV